MLDSRHVPKTEKQKWHKDVATKIRKLGQAISIFTEGKLDFSSWSTPVIPGLPHEDSNGNMFFAMMLLKHYNPDTHKMAFWESQKKNLSCEILWYLISHKLNGSRDSLPEGISNLMMNNSV